MPIKLKANNGNIDLKAPIKQLGGGAVDSVNGMTGDVVLEIPSKTSQLENDSDFATSTAVSNAEERINYKLGSYALKTEIPDVEGFATKSEVKAVDGKIPTDVVEYTPQSLTDTQKAQARENIGAEQASRGFIETSLYMQLKSTYSKRYFNVYVQEGKITQFSDSETDNSDVRLAFRDLYLIMNSGSVTYNNTVIQGTVKHYYAAYQAGLITLPFDCRDSAYSTNHRLIITLNGNTFSVCSTYENGCVYIYDYNVQSNAFSSAIYYGSNIQAISTTALDKAPMVDQFSMSANPTTDMQIATKKYVDDNKTTVPTNVSAFTNDSGYLTLATLPKYDGGVE